MKKTIQKIAQKVGFWEELKETPKQVKMFFIWTLLIVAVVIYILPSISGKLLQGNVINVKSKISGYGYGNDSWYGYSYTDLNVESCKIGQNNNYVVIECVKRPPNVYSQEMQEAFDFAYGIGMTTHSDINRENMYGNITKTEMKKILNAFQKEVMGRDSTIQWISDWDVAVMRADFWTLLSRILWGDKYNWWDPYYQKHLQALKDHWVFSKIDEPFSLEVKWYVYLILKRVAEKKIWLDWVCETPENILACSLHLTSCPQECRPTQCQTPEMVLACSLGLDSCPNECRYGWNNWTWNTIRDVAITKTTFAAANSKEAKVTVEVENVWNVDMNLNGIGHDFYVWDGYGYGTQQDHWQINIEVVDHFVPTLSPWQTDQFVIYVKTKDIPFSKDSYVFLNVISNGDQNVQNNNKKVRIEGNIKPDLWDIIDIDSRERVVTQEVVEKPAVVEDIEKTVVTEVTEEISKERADSLLEMVKNIFK